MSSMNIIILVYWCYKLIWPNTKYHFFTFCSHVTETEEQTTTDGNDRKKKNKMTNNDLQNITQTTLKIE